MIYPDDGPIPASLEEILVETFAATVATAEEFADRWPVIRSGRRDLIPTELRRLIWHRDGGRCQRCWRGRRLVQLDHIVPWSAGGADTSANLRLMCAPCNEERSNYRGGDESPATPIVRACDPCIRDWVRKYGFTRFGRIILGATEVEVFCGNCMCRSVATDPARFL